MPNLLQGHYDSSMLLAQEMQIARKRGGLQIPMLIL